MMWAIEMTRSPLRQSVGRALCETSFRQFRRTDHARVAGCAAARPQKLAAAARSHAPPGGSSGVSPSLSPSAPPPREGGA